MRSGMAFPTQVLVWLYSQTRTPTLAPWPIISPSRMGSPFWIRISYCGPMTPDQVRSLDWGSRFTTGRYSGHLSPRRGRGSVPPVGVQALPSSSGITHDSSKAPSDL